MAKTVMTRWLLAAALASAMSMLEMAVAPLRRALGWSRARTTMIVAITAWVLGLGTVLSFNANATPARGWKSFFCVLEYSFGTPRKRKLN